MNQERNVFGDIINNFKARFELFELTHGGSEVDQISIRIRRPNETVYENQRLIISGYNSEENVFSDIKKIKGPAVLDICVSDRNYGDNFVTIRKR